MFGRLPCAAAASYLPRTTFAANGVSVAAHGPHATKVAKARDIHLWPMVDSCGRDSTLHAAGLRTASKGSSPPDQNQTRAYGASHLKEPDHHRWGPIGLMPDPELRTT
ncbi:hypothetical protein SFRURICE_003245 [Spodoptera frugiperda]|nr:hypothetical protein SFRURICE_003245 [Spodoptera frugiperda]